MDVVAVARAVAVVIGAIILIGGALALVKGSYNRSRIQALREDNDQFRKRLEDTRIDLDDYKVKSEQLSQKVDHQHEEITLLRQMVTQRADVDRVIKLLLDHNKKAEEHWSAERAVFAQLMEKKS